MAYVEIPAGDGTEVERVWQLAPGFADVNRRFRAATTEGTSLPLSIVELARIRIAQINDCHWCLNVRKASQPGDDEVTEEHYQQVSDYRHSDLYSERQKLAIEYAEFFALDPRGVGPEFFNRFRSQFSDHEIVELTVLLARFLGVGRFNKVLGLEEACELVFD